MESGLEMLSGLKQGQCLAQLKLLLLIVALVHSVRASVMGVESPSVVDATTSSESIYTALTAVLSALSDLSGRFGLELGEQMSAVIRATDSIVHALFTQLWAGLWAQRWAVGVILLLAVVLWMVNAVCAALYGSVVVASRTCKAYARALRGIPSYFSVWGGFRLLSDTYSFPWWFVEVTLNTEKTIVEQQSPVPIPADIRRGKEMATNVPMVPVEELPKFAVAIMVRNPDGGHRTIGFASAVVHPRYGRVLVTAKHVWDFALIEESSEDKLLLGREIWGEWRVMSASASLIGYSRKLDIVYFGVPPGVYSTLAIRASKIAPITTGMHVSVLIPPSEGTTQFRTSMSKATVTRAFELAYKASTLAGSSGSPLYNSLGVVGVHTGYETSREGVLSNVGTALFDIGRVLATQPVPGKETEWKRQHALYEWESDGGYSWENEEEDYVDYHDDDYEFRARRRGMVLAGYDELGAKWRPMTDEEWANAQESDDTESHQSHVGGRGWEADVKQGPTKLEGNEALGSKSSNLGNLKRLESSAERSSLIKELKEKILAGGSSVSDKCVSSEPTQPGSSQPASSCEQPALTQDSKNGACPIGPLKQSESPSSTKPDASKRAKRRAKKSKSKSLPKPSGGTPVLGAEEILETLRQLLLSHTKA